MARSSCTSCGLRRQHCQCDHQEASITDDGGERAFKLTRTSFWITYLVTVFALIIFLIFLCLVLLLTHGDSSSNKSKLISSDCHLEIFVDSFSISKAIPNATADWNVSYVTKSPGYACKGSLHVVISHLYQGDKLISESITQDVYGKRSRGKIHGPLSYSVFEKVVTPIGGVVWDLRVQVVSSVKVKGTETDWWDKDGFLIMNCEGIPVNFTSDIDGNVKGSLIGYKRPCEYLFREEYWDKSFF